MLKRAGFAVGGLFSGISGVIFSELLIEKQNDAEKRRFELSVLLTLIAGTIV